MVNPETTQPCENNCPSCGIPLAVENVVTRYVRTRPNDDDANRVGSFEIKCPSCGNTSSAPSGLAQEVADRSLNDLYRRLGL